MRAGKRLFSAKSTMKRRIQASHRVQIRQQFGRKKSACMRSRRRSFAIEAPS